MQMEDAMETPQQHEQPEDQAEAELHSENPAEWQETLPEAEDHAGASMEAIQALQQAMLELRCDMPEAEHYFAPGIYGRKFSMPKGMLVVGKIHKHQHLMMVLKGRAEIITTSGRSLVEAGHVATSEVGAKRVVLALEDTVFMTVHHNPNNTEDLEEIERVHIEDENFNIEFHREFREVLK